MPSGNPNTPAISDRFRGFLPVVVDVETAGFDPKSNALLEVAAVAIDMDGDGRVFPREPIHYHIEPFPNAKLDQRALDFTGIDPYHPFRLAQPEPEALAEFFATIKEWVRQAGCTRAILVGHNPFFDLGFVKAAAERCKLKHPFHSFSSFDTATLAGLAYGQTVLARAVQAAGLDWQENEAHSALYDTERTAELFCTIVNRWRDLELGNGS